jgi:voltage-gated sodium channel
MLRIRERVGRLVDGAVVQRTILTLIVINAVTLGLETSAAVMARAGELLHVADQVILTAFVLEIGARLFARGLRFFRDPWNLFDFAVVAIALVPASGPLAVLRTLRVLRVLRLVSMLPRMRFVVESLLHAVPGILSIAGLMLVLFYVAAVMATGFFGSAFPDWFGGIGASFYTLFQVMTLESWSMGIARPVMEQFPFAWAFFVPFILLATFTMLNLFIAIIVNTMQTMHQKELEQEHAIIEEVVQREELVVAEELRALRNELRELKAALAQSRV